MRQPQDLKRPLKSNEVVWVWYEIYQETLKNLEALDDKKNLKNLENFEALKKS